MCWQIRPIPLGVACGSAPRLRTAGRFGARVFAVARRPFGGAEARLRTALRAAFFRFVAAFGFAAAVRVFFFVAAGFRPLAAGFRRAAAFPPRVFRAAIRSTSPWLVRRSQSGRYS
jgi:hypothetical protein